MPRVRSCHHQSTLGPVMLSPHPPWESPKNDIHQTYIPTAFCVWGGRGVAFCIFWGEVEYGEGSIFWCRWGKKQITFAVRAFLRL